MPSDDIHAILIDFFNYQWKFRDFLTEDDMRCRLYSFLWERMRDDNKSIHSEIRWYGNDIPDGNKNLKYRSDIVILDNEDLIDVDSLNFKLPSKGFSFGKYYYVIELKLRRLNNTDSDNSYDEIIQQDINKLEEVKSRTERIDNYDRKYCEIVFDKKRARKAIIINNNFEWIDWEQ